MTDDTKQSGFDLGEPASGGGYVVLARKYRPETFDDLLGQDAMVTTLRNAFATNRIAQGYMLTGVRGVGKTTTARILARALNYEMADGSINAPTVDLSKGYGVHCRDILKSNHPDVLEMDAASNTGVDNIRELIESARYRPMSARYKVFIIDEVHMLSKGAFNALLKTLEEPPGHVKFIFATTEVRKVPVTVLSRCQRFDLRRVEVDVLTDHFAAICKKEESKAEADALALIARAAEGSVRDGLSILDQAIAMGAGNVTTEAVRAMLGLADRGRVFDLFEVCLSGSPKQVIETFASLHADGADPLQVLTELCDVVHAVTRAKALGAETSGQGLTKEERERTGALADRLSNAILTRAWQLLVAGLDEAAKAPNAHAAVEMVLIRLAFTADLPTPDQLVRAFGRPQRSGPTEMVAEGPPRDTPSANASPSAGAGDNGGRPVLQAVAGETGAGRVAAAASPATDRVELRSFEDVIALAGTQRDAVLKLHLEDHVRLVRFEAQRIEINVLDEAPRDLAGTLGRKLSDWTGQRWIVSVSQEAGSEPAGAVRRRKAADEVEAIRSHPAVAALLEGLPDATIAAVEEIGKGSVEKQLGSEGEADADDNDAGETFDDDDVSQPS